MAAQSIVSAMARCLAAAMVIGMNTAHAAEIKVMASAAVKEAYLDLVPAFEKTSVHKVTTIWTVLPTLPNGSVAARWSISSSWRPPTSTD